MRESLIGHFVFSKAGHDKGELYLIAAQDEKYLYLTDGRLHPLNRPKKKSAKHVQIIKKTIQEPILERLYNKERIFDHEVKYAIKTVLREEEGYV